MIKGLNEGMDMSRAGEYMTRGGYRAFMPAPLPPQPAISMNADIAYNLSLADRALARLDGAVGTIPEPELLVYAFMRQEAVLSSQIEGTQASLEDLFEYELDGTPAAAEADVVDIVRYLEAMKWAIEELKARPISLRLIREAHAMLLSHGRGSQRGPGEFRRAQNWIGPPGCQIEEASFVPPAVPDMHAALANLESFIHAQNRMPELIRCALVHAQFETIHPFWDGNGRIGRMLITLMLCERGILELPVLYLSLYFKTNLEEYYACLQSVRDTGDWERWVLFFLRGVTNTSRSALVAARKIRSLRETMIENAANVSGSSHAIKFGELLFRRPYITAKIAQTSLGVTFPTGNALIASYEEAGYLERLTQGRRHRIFAFRPYLDALHECADDLTEVIGGTDHLATQGP